MCELDERLKQLILEAQRHLPKTPGRNRLLHQLFLEIQNSGKLANYFALCPHPLKASYAEIYAEALQKLFCYITQHLENYQIEKGEVLQWVNGILKWRFLDAVREWREISARIPILSLEELGGIVERLAQSNNTPSFGEQAIDIIKEDPQGIFSKT